MSTNFYWKKLPKWFEENAKAPTTSEDSIFMHIGKRSGAGMYCHKCGTTMHKYGTTEVHGNSNPNIGLLFEGMKDQAHAKEFLEKYVQEKNMYWYEKCPCCGNEPEYVTSFHWTLMIHKKIINDNIKNPESLIVDEYGNEFTCSDFMKACSTPVEYQSACEFS